LRGRASRVRSSQRWPVIGLLSTTSSDGYTERLRAFRLGLKDAGYVEGENVAIEYRWAENQSDRLAALAAELARRPVAVIATIGGQASAFAARRRPRPSPSSSSPPKTRSGSVWSQVSRGQGPT
jgi:ABC-type uncharacterized transport system substrate-binding protein